MEDEEIVKLSLTLTKEIGTLLTKISQLEFQISAKDEIISQLKLQGDTNTNRSREYSPKPGNRMLSDDDVAMVKTLLNRNIPISEIARQFEVNTGVVVAINRNLTYCEVRSWEEVQQERIANGTL